MGIKRKQVLDPVLGFCWYLQIGGTEEAALKWMAKKMGIELPPKDYGENAGCFLYSETTPFMGGIWIGAKSGGGTVAHEAAHAVMHVCRVLEMDPRGCDEFQASYQGYLYRQIVKLFYKK